MEIAKSRGSRGLLSPGRGLTVGSLPFLSPTTLLPLSSLFGGEKLGMSCSATPSTSPPPPWVLPHLGSPRAPRGTAHPTTRVSPEQLRGPPGATLQPPFGTPVQQRSLYHGQQLISNQWSVASPVEKPPLCPPSPALGLPQGLQGAALESPWVLAALPLKHGLSQSIFLADIFFMI